MNTHRNTRCLTRRTDIQVGTAHEERFQDEVHFLHYGCQTNQISNTGSTNVHVGPDRSRTNAETPQCADSTTHGHTTSSETHYLAAVKMPQLTAWHLWPRPWHQSALGQALRVGSKVSFSKTPTAQYHNLEAQCIARHPQRISLDPHQGLPASGQDIFGV